MSFAGKQLHSRLSFVNRMNFAFEVLHLTADKIHQQRGDLHGDQSMNTIIQNCESVKIQILSATLSTDTSNMPCVYVWLHRNNRAKETENPTSGLSYRTGSLASRMRWVRPLG